MCVLHETVWNVGNDDPVFSGWTQAEISMLLHSPDYNSCRIFPIAILTWNHEDAIDVVPAIPRLDHELGRENHMVA